MRGGEVVHPDPCDFLDGRWWVEEAAGEDLPARLAEVLRQEGVEDGVDAGVAIGQAVRHDAEGEGGVIQGEVAKLHPHGDDVVGHPAQEEGSYDQQHCLSCLWAREGERERQRKRVQYLSG